MKTTTYITSLVVLMFSLNCFGEEIIHPLDFSGTEQEKQDVLNFIVAQVYEDYSSVGMDDPVTLRMMEKEELNAFKRLTRVENRELLDDVISDYCSVGMCDYSTIYMMYQEQLSASTQELSC